MELVVHALDHESAQRARVELVAGRLPLAARATRRRRCFKMPRPDEEVVEDGREAWALGVLVEGHPVAWASWSASTSGHPVHYICVAGSRGTEEGGQACAPPRHLLVESLGAIEEPRHSRALRP